MRLIGLKKDNSIDFRARSLESYKDGEMLECQIMTARQSNLLEQAHALCHFAYHNWRDGDFKSYDEFRQFLSIELGYTKVAFTYMAGKLQPIIVAETWSFVASENKFMKGLYNPLTIFLCDYFKCNFEELIGMSEEHKFLNEQIKQ